MLTPQQAYDIASQWGSYINSWDPGACFYGFKINDGRPVSEEHREQCRDYAFDLIKDLRDDEHEEDLDAETAADLKDLRDLWEFFAATELTA